MYYSQLCFISSFCFVRSVVTITEFKMKWKQYNKIKHKKNKIWILFCTKNRSLSNFINCMIFYTYYIESYVHWTYSRYPNNYECMQKQVKVHAIPFCFISIFILWYYSIVNAHMLIAFAMHITSQIENALVLELIAITFNSHFFALKHTHADEIWQSDRKEKSPTHT